MVMMMNDDKIVRTYSLTKKHVAMVDELCEKEQRTASGIIKLAIEQYYKRNINEE